ncbi:hypothetical protein BD311DRAFT_760852 [Dichomitus squalens]|uniref:Uncharacterized protein n=1 Tax=Dichomitus squalens TaxID=114155 RepID=A0A4Q9MME1_9APHY|nr:hypothetical protein BD311DRAFT_760852 [Dichomitus squalens]
MASSAQRQESSVSQGKPGIYVTLCSVWTVDEDWGKCARTCHHDRATTKGLHGPAFPQIPRPISSDLHT